MNINKRVYNQRVDRIFAALITFCTFMYVAVSGLWPTVLGLGLLSVAVPVFGLGGFAVLYGVYALIRIVWEWFWVDDYTWKFADDFGLGWSLLIIVIGSILMYVTYTGFPCIFSTLSSNAWHTCM